MSITIALFGAGAMGSAVGRRLAESGAKVITFLDGRSEATIERARATGLVAAPISAFAEADIILSIVPPAEAQKVADLIVPVLRDSGKNHPSSISMPSARRPWKSWPQALLPQASR